MGIKRGVGCGRSATKRYQHLVMAPLLALTVSSANATESLHYLPLEQAGGSGGLWLDFNDNDQRDWLSRFTEPFREPARSTLLLNRGFADYSLHWGVANSEQQNAQALGLQYGAFSVTGFRGGGDTISTVIHPYNNVGSYQFHGGLNQQYAYSGARLGYDLNATNTVQFSHARIRAAGFNDRTAYALDLSGRKLSLSLTRVEEAGRYAGRAVSARVNIGGYTASAQHLKADNQASYSSLSLESTTPGGRTLGVVVEQRVNPLFADGNENRVTLHYGFRFGGSPAMAIDQPTEGESKRSGGESGGGNNTAILAGAGAVGAALALSGGSGGGGDDRARFTNQHSAAFEVLNDINPTSIRQNREYGGYVYRNADGSFSSTNPIKGQPASVLLPNPSTVAPGGGQTTASYHTHAASDPRFDNEHFSPQDLRSLNLFQLDGYLGTPLGQFKFADFSSRTISVIGGPGYLATGN